MLLMRGPKGPVCLVEELFEECPILNSLNSLDIGNAGRIPDERNGISGIAMARV